MGGDTWKCEDIQDSKKGGEREKSQSVGEERSRSRMENGMDLGLVFTLTESG